MILVLDTNVFVSDFRMAGTGFRTLFGAGERLGIQVRMSAVVRDELVSKHAAEVTKDLDEARKPLEKLRRNTGGSVNVGVPSLSIEELEAEYGSFLDSKLAEVNARVLEYPPNTHADVAGRANARARPFSERKKGKDDEGDKGYRDTLIWLSVLDLARSAVSAKIVFVSADKQDFADSDGIQLHPDLRSEFAAINSAASILYYPSLDDFICTEVKPKLESLDEISAKLQSGKHPHLDLRARVCERLPDLAKDAAFDFETRASTGEAHYSRITKVVHVEAIRDVDVRCLSDDELLVEFEAAVACRVERASRSVPGTAGTEAEPAGTPCAPDVSTAQPCSETQEFAARLRLTYSESQKVPTSVDLLELRPTQQPFALIDALRTMKGLFREPPPEFARILHGVRDLEMQMRAIETGATKGMDQFREGWGLISSRVDQASREYRMLTDSLTAVLRAPIRPDSPAGLLMKAIKVLCQPMGGPGGKASAESTKAPSLPTCQEKVPDIEENPEQGSRTEG